MQKPPLASESYPRIVTLASLFTDFHFYRVGVRRIHILSIYRTVCPYFVVIGFAFFQLPVRVFDCLVFLAGRYLFKAGVLFGGTVYEIAAGAGYFLPAYQGSLALRIGGFHARSFGKRRLCGYSFAEGAIEFFSVHRLVGAYLVFIALPRLKALPGIRSPCHRSRALVPFGAAIVLVYFIAVCPAYRRPGQFNLIISCRCGLHTRRRCRLADCWNVRFRLLFQCFDCLAQRRYLCLYFLCGGVLFISGCPGICQRGL